MDINRSGGPELLRRIDSRQFSALIREIEAVTDRRGLSEQLAPAAFDDDRTGMTTMYWSLRLMLAMRERVFDVARRVHGYYGLSFGFLDPEYEENGFGVIAHAAVSEFARPYVLDELGAGDGYTTNNFRLWVRPTTFVDHALPKVHLSLGTAACWATSRATSASPIGPGVLTAKHVVGSSIGTPVTFTDGSHGKVLDVGYQGIDAAIVETAETAMGLTRIATTSNVWPYLDVEFHGAASGLCTTKVTSVTDTFGIFNSAALPARVYIAGTGKRGDSGALIRRTGGAREVIGIYLGAGASPAGQSFGFAQHAQQVAETMDMEVFE